MAAEPLEMRAAICSDVLFGSLSASISVVCFGAVSGKAEGLLTTHLSLSATILRAPQLGHHGSR
jgi:hypothetical protein